MNINSLIIGTIAILILLIYTLFIIKDLRAQTLQKRILELEIDLTNALEQIFEMEKEGLSVGRNSFLTDEK